MNWLLGLIAIFAALYLLVGTVLVAIVWIGDRKRPPLRTTLELIFTWIVSFKDQKPDW